ncbi:collagen alpha-2(I) chain-like [Corticium candelabrum]|uniref:collagen alpha-2(I) chain-like n=1 Tax=Corticium candelabrum TaxID=121492 RepID=UPI002E275C7E|nr:collagen alpha-2(I) chain-like [Corticium candelabrum]
MMVSRLVSRTLCSSTPCNVIGFPGPIGLTAIPGPAVSSGAVGRTGEPGPAGPRGLPGIMATKGERGTPGSSWQMTIIGELGARSKVGAKGGKREILRVQANGVAKGDLESSSKYLQTYFNCDTIGSPWQSGESDGPFCNMDSYPIEKDVRASSFKMVVESLRGVGGGNIRFTLIKFKVVGKRSR